MRIDWNCNRKGCEGRVTKYRDNLCDDCRLRGQLKSALRAKIRQRDSRNIIRAMKDVARVKLSNELILELKKEDEENAVPKTSK